MVRGAIGARMLSSQSSQSVVGDSVIVPLGSSTDVPPWLTTCNVALADPLQRVRGTG